MYVYTCVCVCVCVFVYVCIYNDGQHQGAQHSMHAFVGVRALVEISKFLESARHNFAIHVR